MDTEAQLDLFSTDDSWPDLAEYGHTIPARATDPQTSHAATRAIVVRAGTQRHYLLAQFAAGDHLTDEQAMEASPFVRPTSEYAKRCSELRDAGLIEPTGETRPGTAGPQRIVCRITELGRKALHHGEA